MGQLAPGFDLDNTVNQEDWDQFGKGWVHNWDQNGAASNLDGSLDPYIWSSGLGQDGVQSSEDIFADQAQQLGLWDGNWSAQLDRVE